MSQYYLFQDAKKCINCRACEVQCLSNKSLGPGPRLCQVVTVGPRWVGDRPRAAYTFMPCFHCENPWCVAACPTGAMQRRSSDGIVFVDSNLCVGCKTCMSACPWGAPQWNAEQGKVVKCDYCIDRLEKGQDPACVTVCPTGCLVFGRPEDVPPVRRVRYAEAMSHLGEPNPSRESR